MAGICKVGKLTQRTYQYPTERIKVIEGAGLDVKTIIINHLDTWYNSIIEGNPVMEKSLPKSEIRMNLTELVFETAKLYLSEGNNMDNYIMQGKMFTAGQCNVIYERVSKTGMMTTIEAVTKILSGYKI